MGGNQYTVAKWTDADYIAHWKAKCVVTPAGCWEWQGFCYDFRNIKPGQRGYPAGCYRGKSVRLHRKMLELKLGRLLEKHELACHDCDNPPCINPDHLFAGTQEQNKLDELAKGRSFYANKTHCLHGHPFNEENTFHTVGKKGRPRRVCKACCRMRTRIKAGWDLAEARDMPAVPAEYRNLFKGSVQPQRDEHGR